jgi:transketolase
MGSIVNGMSLTKLRPFGPGFLIFSDYARGAIRLSALMELPVVHIFTHDSIGVGEDGPTHEPIETVSALRLIPNMEVIRPADPEETAGAFAAALERTDGPTLIALTRQGVPVLNEISPHVRRAGVLKGAYVALQESAPLGVILLSSGSELQLALAAAKVLGPGARVVSVPSFEIFDRQPAEYRESILPGACRRRVAVEAGVTALWRKYVGLDGAVVGIDRFGLSAPAPVIYTELGITAEAVVAAARSLGA